VEGCQEEPEWLLGAKKQKGGDRRERNFMERGGAKSGGRMEKKKGKIESNLQHKGHILIERKRKVM